LRASDSTNKVFQTILLPSNAQILSSDGISLGVPIYSFNLAITNYVVWDDEKNKFTYPLAHNAQYIGGEINTFFDVFEDSLYVGKQEVHFKGNIASETWIWCTEVIDGKKYLAQV